MLQKVYWGCWIVGVLLIVLSRPELFGRCDRLLEAAHSALERRHESQ